LKVFEGENGIVIVMFTVLAWSVAPCVYKVTIALQLFCWMLAYSVFLKSSCESIEARWLKKLVVVPGIAREHCLFDLQSVVATITKKNQDMFLLLRDDDVV